jgi:tetratricopeptide (TPR) repeat protein
MSPAVVAPVGGTVVMAPLSKYAYSGNPIREMASALAEKAEQGLSLNADLLTSLAPPTPGAYQSAMLRGESLFRQGKYQEAATSFEAARNLSNGSAESMLSLAHVDFAMGDKTYAQAAECLAKALVLFPDLPLVRVRPESFYGNVEDYKKDLADLEKYAADNAKDPGALLLLGYMQWRGGLVDKALNSLDTAMANAPKGGLADGIAMMLDGITRSGQIIRSEAPPLGALRDCSWAGVRVALPTTFKPSPLASPNQVVAGLIGEGKDAPQEITLYAYPVAAGDMTVKAFMDGMTNYMRESPSVNDMTTDAEAEVPFQTGSALVRMFTYQQASRDTKTAMGWVAFIREPKEKADVRVAYILGLATTEKQSDKLLGTLAAVCKSLSLSAPEPVSPGSIDTNGSTMEDRRFGFSIVQPWGWSGKPTDRGLEMGQMDFAGGNVISPRVEVIVQTIPGSYTPQSFGEEAIQRKVPKGVTRKVLSQGPAKLADQDGYQFVVGQAPERGAGGATAILVGRLICLDKPDGAKMMYAIVVECSDAEAQDVESLAEKIASGFKLVPPEQAP